MSDDGEDEAERLYDTTKGLAECRVLEAYAMHELVKTGRDPDQPGAIIMAFSAYTAVRIVSVDGSVRVRRMLAGDVCVIKAPPPDAPAPTDTPTDGGAN